MQLSEHFTLEEFTLSQSAVRAGIDNTPTPEVLAILKTVTAPGMERVRELLGAPISISSGYRSPALNAKVGGAATSAHVKGYAVDFNCHAFGAPLAVAQDLAECALGFDQLIHEFGTWVHISFEPRPMRRQLLTIDHQGTRPGLVAVR
jgi:zinc D-Ala-D-Ala carboxypeptidase